MPNMKNAIKKVKVNVKKTEQNNLFEAAMKTAIKNVVKAVKNNDKDLADKNLKVAIKQLDKAVGKGVVKENYCARQKSRLTKLVNEMK